MGLISKFILPKEVDFDNALQQQAHITRLNVDALLKPAPKTISVYCRK